MISVSPIIQSDYYPWRNLNSAYTEFYQVTKLPKRFGSSSVATSIREALYEAYNSA